MMHKRLRRKGWSGQELQELHNAKLKAEKRRSGATKFLYNYLFWFIMAAAIIVNFLIAFVFIPISLVLTTFYLYLVVIVTGTGFGLLFENLLSNLEELSQHHYILMLAVVPCLASLSVILFSTFANFLAIIFGLGFMKHNPISLGVVYGISFFAPFAVKQTLKKD